MLDSQYDVVIVGSGPAGAAAAQAIREAADAPLIERRAVVVEEIEGDVLAVTQQTLRDQAAVAAPATRHDDAVVELRVPAAQNAADFERRRAASRGVEDLLALLQ